MRQRVLRHLQGALLQSLAVDFLDDVVIDTRIREPLFETIGPQAAVLEVRQADDEDLRVDAVLAGVGTVPQSGLLSRCLVVDTHVAERALHGVRLGEHVDTAPIRLGHDRAQRLGIHRSQHEHVDSLGDQVLRLRDLRRDVEIGVGDDDVDIQLGGASLGGAADVLIPLV